MEGRDHGMPIRVLEIVTDMGRGGIETMLMNHYRQMDRTQVQLDFLTHRSKRAVYDDEIEEMGGKLYRLPPLNPVGFNYQKQLKNFFAQHTEYRIVHSHLDCMAGVPLKAAKEFGVPVRIAHAHSSNQTKNSKYPIKLVYKNQITKYATDLFACGEAAGEWMFGGAPFAVMHNAIDAGKFRYQPDLRECARKALIPEMLDAFVVGHVGSFWSPKNHLFLLDIFREIYKQEPNSVLLLVGTGGLMDEVREKAKSYGIENHVKLLGDRSDVFWVEQAMDVFVLPSLFEGLPVTMIEAQASSLPCFISEKVPIECKVTDLVTQISLKAAPAVWARKILDSRNLPRRDTSAEIAQAGFDIRENAAWLQNFYLEQWKANE